MGDRRAPSVHTTRPIEGGLGSFVVFEGSNEEGWSSCVLSHASFDYAQVTTSIIVVYACGGCGAVVDEEELTILECVISDPRRFLSNLTADI